MATTIKDTVTPLCNDFDSSNPTDGLTSPNTNHYTTRDHRLPCCQAQAARLSLHLLGNKAQQEQLKNSRRPGRPPIRYFLASSDDTVRTAARSVGDLVAIFAEQGSPWNSIRFASTIYGLRGGGERHSRYTRRLGVRQGERTLYAARSGERPFFHARKHAGRDSRLTVAACGRARYHRIPRQRGGESGGPGVLEATTTITPTPPPPWLTWPTTTTLPSAVRHLHTSRQRRWGIRDLRGQKAVPRPSGGEETRSSLFTR